MKNRSCPLTTILATLLALTALLTACSSGGQEPLPSQEPEDEPAPGQEIDPDKEVLVLAQTSDANGETALRL